MTAAPPAKKRTAAAIRRELLRLQEEVARRRDAPVRPGGERDHFEAWWALTPDVQRLMDELTAAEIAEDEEHKRPVRWTVTWAAVAAVASAVAAAGTWWQVSHAPPVRVELVAPPPAQPQAPGPWRQ